MWVQSHTNSPGKRPVTSPELLRRGRLVRVKEHKQQAFAVVLFPEVHSLVFASFVSKNNLAWWALVNVE